MMMKMNLFPFALFFLGACFAFPFESWAGKDKPTDSLTQKNTAQNKNGLKDQKVAELKKKHNRIVKIFEDWQQAVAKENQKTAAALHQEYLKEQQEFQKKWKSWEKEMQAHLKKAEKAIGDEAGKIQGEMNKAAEQ